MVQRRLHHGHIDKPEFLEFQPENADFAIFSKSCGKNITPAVEFWQQRNNGFFLIFRKLTLFFQSNPAFKTQAEVLKAEAKFYQREPKASKQSHENHHRNRSQRPPNDSGGLLICTPILRWQQHKFPASTRHGNEAT